MKRAGQNPSARRESAITERMREATAHGFNALTQCSCGNTREFAFDTDSMTGSSYAKCCVCFKVHPFRGAWRDNALGMNFGSWWTQKLAPGFVEEV